MGIVFDVYLDIKLVSNGKFVGIVPKTLGKIISNNNVDCVDDRLYMVGIVDGNVRVVVKGRKV